MIRVEYDNLGRKTALRDPNLGHIEYLVDPLGRTISQMSPKQRSAFNSTNREEEKTRTRYDKLDRMTARYEPDLESHWAFDTAANGIGKLAEAYTQTGAGKDYRRVHAYDAFGRPGKTTQSLTDGTYAATPGYDAWGRLISQTYQRNSDPAKVFDTRYSSTGYLARIERGSLVLWQVNGQDAGMRPTSIALGNGLKQTRGFYPHSGRMKNGVLATAGGEPRLQEGYEYDVLGNVAVRTQHWDLGFREVFTYDALNRIETSTVDGQPTQTFRYDASGNMLSKTGVGTGDYVYPPQGAGSVRPHAVQSIPGVGSFAYDDNGNLLSGSNRSVSWTSFDMPDRIDGAGASARFVYGPEHQRTRQTRGDGTTVIYAGAQEIEKNASGTTVKTYWPNGIGVEIDRPNAAVSELYWHQLDRLGSVIGLTDQQGVLKEKLAYDTWGKRRTTDSRPMEGTPTPNSLDGKVDNRGFTRHEMLDQLDLVHMNGRVYDPFLARFFSADPIVADPLNGQSLNRYSYVFNNPANLVDPSGFTPDCAQPEGQTCQQVDVHGERESEDTSKSGHSLIGMTSTRSHSSPNAPIVFWHRGHWVGKTNPKLNGDSSDGSSSKYDEFSQWAHVGLSVGGAIPGIGIFTDVVDLTLTAAEIPFDKSDKGDLALGAIGIGATLIPGLGDGAAAAAKIRRRVARFADTAEDAIRWKLGPNDLDFRGTGKSLQDALSTAFEKTGIAKSDFEVTRWGKDANGKSFPVEWRHKNGAEVNIDWPHAKNGPDVPHVGFQTSGKRSTNGAVRGHILLDNVPYNR